MNVIIARGNTKLETQVRYLEDEVITLKTAIEEAIIKGQKSLGRLSDIPGWRVVFDKDLALTRTDAGPGVVGWIDDF